jgi:hypothetical protein
MEKHNPWKRLKELEGTATAMFQRLLGADPQALAHLPYQLNDALTDYLASENVDADESKVFTVDFKINKNPYSGALSSECIWYPPKNRPSHPTPRIDTALRLMYLLKWLEGSQFRNFPFTGQMLVKQEILILFWAVFVVPELHAEGVTLYQSKRRRRTNSGTGKTPQPAETDTVRDTAKKLWRSGIDRKEAAARLSSEFGFSVRRANQIQSDIGWHGIRGRKKNQKKKKE